MLHMVLVSLASSVVGATIVVGVVFLLLNIFAPQVFLETAPAKTEKFQLETAIINRILSGKMTGSASESQIVGQPMRIYRIKVSLAANAFNPAEHEYILGTYEDQPDSPDQSEQNIPQQQKAMSATRVQ